MSKCNKVKSTWFQDPESKKKCNDINGCSWDKHLSGYYCEPEILKIKFTDPLTIYYNLDTGAPLNNIVLTKNDTVDVNYYHKNNIEVWKSINPNNSDKNLPNIFNLKKGKITEDDLSDYFLAGIFFQYKNDSKEIILNVHEFINILALCYIDNNISKKDRGNNYNTYNQYLYNYLPGITNPLNNKLWDITIIEQIYDFYFKKVWDKLHQNDSISSYLQNYIKDIKSIKALTTSWNKKKLGAHISKNSLDIINYILLTLKKIPLIGSYFFSLGWTQVTRNNNKLNWNDWNRKHSTSSDYKQNIIWIIKTISMVLLVISTLGFGTTILFGGGLTMGLVVTTLTCVSAALTTIRYIFDLYKSTNQQDHIGTILNLYSIAGGIYTHDTIDNFTSLKFQLGYGKVTQQTLHNVPSMSGGYFKEVASYFGSSDPEWWDVLTNIKNYVDISTQDYNGVTWIDKGIVDTIQSSLPKGSLEFGVADFEQAGSLFVGTAGLASYGVATGVVGVNKYIASKTGIKQPGLVVVAGAAAISVAKLTSQIGELIKTAFTITLLKSLNNEKIDSPVEKKILNTIFKHNHIKKSELLNNRINELNKRHPGGIQFRLKGPGLSPKEVSESVLESMKWLLDEKKYNETINLENCPVSNIYQPKTKSKKFVTEAKRLSNIKCNSHCSESQYNKDLTKCVYRKHLFNCPLDTNYNESECKKWCKSKNLMGDHLNRCITRENNIYCNSSKNPKVCPIICKKQGLFIGPNYKKRANNNVFKTNIDKVNKQYENCVKSHTLFEYSKPTKRIKNNTLMEKNGVKKNRKTRRNSNFSKYRSSLSRKTQNRYSRKA